VFVTQVGTLLRSGYAGDSHSRHGDKDLGSYRNEKVSQLLSLKPEVVNEAETYLGVRR
jgi:hypothetical protein